MNTENTRIEDLALAVGVLELPETPEEKLNRLGHVMTAVIVGCLLSTILMWSFALGMIP